MNERIRELAEHVGGEIYTGFAGSPNSIKFTESYFEKFAKLIIQECAGIAKRNMPKPNGYDSNYDELAAAAKTAQEIYDDIIYHFGVEK